MKQKMLIRLCSIMLCISMALTTLTATQIIRAYAQEGEGENYADDVQNDEVQEEQEWQEEPEEQEVQEEPAPEPQPDQSDPFDYNLICYTPSISFGTVNHGDVVYAKQFNIVNVGSATFPLTWEETDPNTAFDVGYVSPDNYMDPGESITFFVAPVENLAPGSYTCRLTFFSANDYRRHHTAIVDLSVTVKDNTPFITSVDVAPGSVTMAAGKSYKFDAYVSGGNDFNPNVTWSLAGNGSSGTTVDGSGNLYVSPNETASSFAVIATSVQDPSRAGRCIVTVTSVDYVVSVKADPASEGAVAGGGAVRSGGNCTVSASPNNNFSFQGWYQNGTLVSNSSSYTINGVNSDMNLVAKFARQTCYVKTSVNNADAGTITGSSSVAYGGSYTITAKANSGYSFAGFVEDNKTISTASSIQLNNITSDRNIQAVFNRDTCNVNVSVNPQDTGKYEGAGKYNKGSKVELRASAYDGYEFTGWTINGQVVSKDTKYVIDGIKNDVNVVANFMKKNANTYKITSGIATSGGSITPSGDFVVAEGGSVTYNIMAQADYKISSVVVDGKNIGAVASYTFNNVRGGHTITAAFEKKAEITPQKSNSASNSSGRAQAPIAQENTEYNDKTAADGAVQEQKIVNTKIPEQTEELQGEEYAEDVITEAPEETSETDTEAVSNNSVMARHDLDEATLRILIKDDAALPMLREAYEDGTLQITINNSYAKDKQETAVELYYSKPTLINFEDVIAETLTAEEKYAVLTGTPVSFNIDITENTKTVDESTKKIMQTKIGYKPVSYFDFGIMKTSGGTTSVINNTSAELEVVVPIPEEYRKEGRKFYVIRNHNGVVDILQNVGSDPDTITFRTDRFSEYAIAYEAVNVNRLMLQMVIVMLVSLTLGIICFTALVKYRRKARRAQKR